MKVLNEICGERFYVWDGNNYGKCFQKLALSFPPHLLLLLVSAYYLGYRKITNTLRPKFERTIIYTRIFLCTLLIFLPSFHFYTNYLNSIHLSSVFCLEIVLALFSWIIHIAFLRKHLYGITYRIRGPLIIILSLVACFLTSLVILYLQCTSKQSLCTNKTFILSIIVQFLYVCTFCLPGTNLSDHAWTINSTDNERSPLLASAVSRYYQFFEDDQHLGTAEVGNIFSKILFLWVKPLIEKGVNARLKSLEDLFDLPVPLRTSHLRARIASRCVSSGYLSSHLACQLHKLFSTEFYCIGILKFISDCLSFGGPLLLNAIVSLIEDENKSNSKDGYYYAAALFLTTLLCAVCSAQYNYLISRLSLKMKASIIMMVYEKVLSLNKVTLSSINTGEIANFISTDTDRIVNFCQTFHQFWSLPIQVVIALVLLYQQLSFCFVIGLGFMIFVIPINQYIAKKIAGYSSLLMTAKDKRIKMMNEMVSGIRTIKMNTWEKFFSDKLKSLRLNEMKYLKKRKYLDALCVYFWATTPVLMSFLTFTLYSSLGYALTAARVFTSIALFNVLILPLNAFPWVLNGLVEAWISVKRVNTFLKLSRLQNFSELEEGSNARLEILDGVFSYSAANDPNSSSEPSSKFLLGPINLKIKPGDLVCIYGKVGSGKSSLLSSILSDMHCVTGEVRLNLRDKSMGIGYVSQEPWIQQKKIKDNILFGSNWSTFKYKAVLEKCALLQDLEVLPEGDQTQVGDQGVTLSGGQKARLALARAVYQDFDVYLLDDPLSAVDANVADHIFSHCIMGSLKNKTRILCTHKMQIAEKADHVIVLSEGRLVSQGPPNRALPLLEQQEEKENPCEAVITEPPALLESSVSAVSEEGQNEEQREEGIIKFHVYKTYWRAAGAALSTAVLLFCLLMQASRSFSDGWLAFWVSSTTDPKNVTDAPGSVTYSKKRPLSFYLWVYGGLAASNSVFTLFRSFLFAWAGVKAATVLHNRLVRNVIQGSVSFFDVTPLGRVLNRFSSDVYCVDDTLPFVLNILLAQVFSLLGCVIVTCYASPLMIIVIAMLVIHYYDLQRFYRFTSRELKRLSSVSLSPIYAHFSETLNGQSTIRAMAAIPRFQKEMMERVDCNVQACLAIAAASQWLNIWLQGFGVILVTCLALLSVGAGSVHPGLVGLALSYALSITGLLNGTVTFFSETEKEMVSVERMVDYINHIHPESNDWIQRPPTSWPSHGVIEFREVSLRYRPSCPYALQGLSFETRPGEKIGIVGRTGSGKSSVLKVLYRMVDNYEGQVRIDGVDIARIDLKELRSSMSVIPQDPFLFSGTLRENLDPLHLMSEKQLWQSLRDCSLESKVQQLGGLDLSVDERGLNFSVGERQLLCLARALLKKAKVVCVDEATANVDSRTDSLIRYTLRMSFRRSTVLVIAHRIETVLECDRVIVMAGGKILEMGAPADLLAQPYSHFRKLVHATR